MVEQVAGGLAFAGFFCVGLLVFRGTIRVRPSSRASSSFDRHWPKLWGGLVMTLTGFPLVVTLLKAVGALGAR